MTQKRQFQHPNISLCPLCGGAAVENFHADRHRAYLRCSTCLLVFVPERFHLDPSAEKAEYDRHENRPDDPGYRRFLSRLTEPLLERIGAGKIGLDFGCGPGPAIPAMLEEPGHVVERYDPIYFDDPAVFAKTYDFICATEVVEHLRNPGRELERLFSLLKPGGWLGIMTKLVIDQEAFQRWHYIRDLTHIAFFSRETFEFFARRLGAELIFAGKDVVLMRKEWRSG
ncbi:MAG: class I SAM-dependent methyltransferase [Desulfococcaceae bacterium]